MAEDGTVQLCRLEDIPDGAARGFVFEAAGARRDVLVHRAGDRVRAYVNACPHSYTPLETFPDRFMSRDGRHLLCSTHGALFRPDDGYCVEGPCKGRSLTALAARLESGHVAVAPCPPARKDTP